MKNTLQPYLDDNRIMVNKHQDHDLFIYNYTKTTQYKGDWDEITLRCRGLILDGQGNIVAQPFKKFFNKEELRPEEIPSEPFEIYKKMDGSLGILFHWQGEFHIATRGSFHSDQAIRANEILKTKYRDSIDKLNPDHTYLFEIIYPENRIVVHYEDEQLILLGIIDRVSGGELPLNHTLGFPVVEKIDWSDSLDQLQSLNLENQEGYVVRFVNGFRMKIKFEEYCRLHRIVTNTSSRSIWDALRNGQDLQDIIEQVPDEFYDWVKSTKESLESSFRAIEQEARDAMQEFPTRKEFALYAKNQKWPSIMFLMLEGRDYSQSIWKMLKPEHERPFRENS